MSKREGEAQLPRDAQVVHALRRELKRNTRQISHTFWQEFELIRSQQRVQLEQERRNRERITTLMHDTNLEAQQQLEALSRSISSHGINPSAPSPRMRREVPAILSQARLEAEEAKVLNSKISPAQLNRKRQISALKRRPLSLGLRFPASSPNLPRAPPSSQATIDPNSPSPILTNIRSSPQTSKLKLSNKPKT